jgi:hypothetical protein
MKIQVLEEKQLQVEEKNHIVGDVNIFSLHLN